MKYRVRMMRKLLTGLVAAALLVAIPGQYAFAAQTYYEQKTQQTISRGVTYEENSRMTDAGIQNIYTMTVDLTESTLEFKAVDSTVEYGLKETAKKMLEDNGALGGVNADFFGLTGSYSASFGPMIVDGELVSAGTSVNQEADEYASFFMDEDGNPFFEYFKLSASFANHNKVIELASLNKITSMVYPIYFDAQAAATTADLDKRFAELVKIVVEDDEITYISQPGELVTVPEDGYLIIMSKDYRITTAAEYAVGDEVYVDMRSTVQLDRMEQAFGGGGKLLANGAEAAASSIVGAGRQPRTAFGISQDGNTAIFMVVDGRGESVGATHSEMAGLMREYGAYAAMHLDGGGSSTMVAKTTDDAALETKNTVSEGSERKVINAVGVFQTAEAGAIEEIRIASSLTRTVPGKTITFQAYGLDEYYNRIAIPAEQVQMEAIGVAGTWNGYDFTPSESGTFNVSATYNRGEEEERLTAVKEAVVSGVTSYLNPSSTTMKVGGAGEVVKVAMQVVDTEGFAHWVSSTTQYEVADTSVGTMNVNAFTALKNGSTYIKCTRDGQSAYISVTVGDAQPVALPSATSLPDPLLGAVNAGQDGAFYLNIAGGLAYSGAETINADQYASVRGEARSTIDSNAEVAIYGGTTGMDSATKLDSLSWNGSYRFLNRGGASVVMMPTTKGGISATNGSQWATFTKDIADADNDAIVFVMDKTPSNFTSASETAYFRAILDKYVAAGKSVFVVSCSGNAQWTSLKDGVRYINLPDLWKADGTRNTNFSMLKLRVNGAEVSYEITKI